MIIRKTAYPRAGLIGNPSDGYFGKTIAFTFSNFQADVVLYQTPELEILPNTRDHSVFKSVAELAEDVQLFGYYGGIRLLKAAVKRFHDYCCAQGTGLADKNFTIRYQSSIPHRVGLAGSSAIIVACFRAMMEFYQVEIPKAELANLILSVETDELQISAGLQDRVAQVYQGLVYMDFAEGIMEQKGHGDYDELDPVLLPPLYIAYRSDLSEGSEVVHSDMRERYHAGDTVVMEAMTFWSNLTDKVRDGLALGKVDEVGALLDGNFDRRREIQAISAGNIAMVEAARSLGCSAKFTGSGGAIVGTCGDDARLTALKEKMARMGVEVIKPQVVPAMEETS